jgi:TDG/mug DNA glycosylase family protein
MENSLTDILEGNLAIVFCGINPGLKSANEGHHFSGRNTRFWRILYLAGFTPYEIQAKDDRSLSKFGYGLTTAVERPTARADELSEDDFAESIDTLRKKIKLYKPLYIAFLGKVAYAAFSGKKKVVWGIQDDLFEGSIVWVLPNPSGLNRSFSLSRLVNAYKELQNCIGRK